VAKVGGPNELNLWSFYSNQENCISYLDFGHTLIYLNLLRE
jgi:hypothetical protein